MTIAEKERFLFPSREEVVIKFVVNGSSSRSLGSEETKMNNSFTLSFYQVTRPRSICEEEAHILFSFLCLLAFIDFT